MSLLKLLLVFVSGILVSACSEAAASLGEPNLPVTQSTPPVVLSQDEETELRFLVEQSDLIVVGKVTGARFLVDPAKMERATEKALREKRKVKDNVYEVEIAQGDEYIGGKIFDVVVDETLYYKPELSKPQIARIYSVGNPFSLHTRVIPMIPGQKYLLFLKQAMDKDIVNELRIQNSDTTRTAEFERVRADDVFLATNEAPAAVQPFKNKKRVIEIVESIVRELTPQNR